MTPCFWAYMETMAGPAGGGGLGDNGGLPEGEGWCAWIGPAAAAGSRASTHQRQVRASDWDCWLSVSVVCAEQQAACTYVQAPR